MTCAAGSGRPRSRPCSRWSPGRWPSRTPRACCFRGLRTVAFDGCNSIKVPDTDRNRGWLGQIRYRMGFAGYPTLRLMTLVETGTRGLLGATFGPPTTGTRPPWPGGCCRCCDPGMLLLLDRGFDASRLPRPPSPHRREAAGPQQVHPQPTGAGSTCPTAPTCPISTA